MLFFDDALTFSDTHDNGTTAYSQEKAILIGYVRHELPDLLVMNGDIFDPWKAPWNTLKRSIFHDMVEDMIAERVRKCLYTIWIDRNHDYRPPKDFFSFGEPYFHICKDYTATIQGKVYKWEHGWEYDITWGGLWKIPGIYPIAFFIAKHAPWLMVPLYNFLFRRNSPGVQRNYIDEMISEEQDLERINARLGYLPEFIDSGIEEWTWHYAIIHDRVRAQVHKDKIIRHIGHTHYPWDFDGLMCDSGAGLEDLTIIRTTKVPELLFLKEV